MQEERIIIIVIIIIIIIIHHHHPHQYHTTTVIIIIICITTTVTFYLMSALKSAYKLHTLALPHDDPHGVEDVVWGDVGQLATGELISEYI